jgi:hypothetical protein
MRNLEKGSILMFYECMSFNMIYVSHLNCCLVSFNVEKGGGNSIGGNEKTTYADEGRKWLYFNNCFGNVWKCIKFYIKKNFLKNLYKSRYRRPVNHMIERFSIDKRCSHSALNLKLRYTILLHIWIFYLIMTPVTDWQLHYMTNVIIVNLRSSAFFFYVVIYHFRLLMAYIFPS